MSDETKPSASVGEVPPEAERGNPSLQDPRAEREQHLIIRRRRVGFPDDEDLDDGPDVDPDTGALRPATYRERGLKVRDN